MFTSYDYANTTTLTGINGTNYTVYASHGIYGDIGYYLAFGRCRAIVAEHSSVQNPTDYIFPGVYFGSGSTPATKANYKLETPITTGLAISNTGVSIGADNGEYYARASYVLENTTAEDITIAEIGIFTAMTTKRVNSYSTNTNFSNFLMERSVLDAPVVIAPGEIKTITYKITFNQSVS